MIPCPRSRQFAALARDIAQMPQRDQILRIERERSLENAARFLVFARLEQCLAKNNVPAHVRGLLWHIRSANRYGLLEIPRLTVFVGEGRKIPAWVLVELSLEFLDPGGTGHRLPRKRRA